jgi:hypothetical protein|tara:strand:- start:427 stop:819 length:393 start_codon:yes stop_codon:yes gene_type:complete
MKFKDILEEEAEKIAHGRTRMDISIGLLYKAMNKLTDAVRDIESATQYMEDNEKKNTIEGFKNSLLGDFGTQFTNFNDNYSGHDKLINKIDKFIKDNSQNKDNFNLSNDAETKAPVGDYVNGNFPGLDNS